MLRLVDDVLDISRIESGKVDLRSDVLDLASVVDGTLEMVRGQARDQGTTLHAEVDPDLPDELRGDRARLQQVMLNLVTNAIKYTGEGDVRLTVQIDERSAKAARMRFSVSDTGVGIPEDRRAQIFDAFVQVDASVSRQHGGTGLGLAICRHIVDAMDGEMGLESEVGRGSTFWFTVPLERKSLPRPKVASSTTEIQVQQARVLVAEDNEVNRRVAELMLTRLGLDVEMVHNGQEAVDAVARRAHDLVLMDCEMPVMDGYTATARIRQMEAPGERVPIIAITAHVMLSDRQRCFEVGMDDYLSKPIALEKLKSTLKRWLARR